MKLWTVVVSVCLALCCGSAHASPSNPANPTHPIRLSRLFATMGDPIKVPPEWDGVWMVEDSTFDCEANFQDYSAVTDTMCTGQSMGGTIDPGFQWTCTGSADASDVDVTCNGNSEVFPDCTLGYSMHIVAHRSADTYQSVITTTSTYSGSACGSFPPQCDRTSSRATRQGAAPADFCATAVKPKTWGQLRLYYK